MRVDRRVSHTRFPNEVVLEPVVPVYFLCRKVPRVVETRREKGLSYVPSPFLSTRYPLTVSLDAYTALHIRERDLLIRILTFRLC